LEVEVPNLYLAVRNAILKSVTGAPYTFSYAADGFAVRKKYLPFGKDTNFDRAWDDISSLNAPYFGGTMPDIRWRAHTCIWAASNCARLDGDFAEFGVNTGILSSMVFRVLGEWIRDRHMFLFDTFHGIPLDSVSAGEARHAREMNETLYAKDVYEFTKAQFAPYPNVQLVRGLLPDTLSALNGRRLSYVSIDLNAAATEMAVIEGIWDQLVPGAHVVLDDYGFGRHEEQNSAWNQFAARAGRMILAMPTGQGVLIK
jgi:hypothetical protein